MERRSVSLNVDLTTNSKLYVFDSRCCFDLEEVEVYRIHRAAKWW